MPGQKNEPIPGLVPCPGPKHPGSPGRLEEFPPCRTQAPGPGVVQGHVELKGPGGHMPLRSPGHIDLDDTTENIGPMENRREPSDKADALGRGEGNHRKVGAGVPAQRQRNSIHEHGNLPVFPASKSRLSLTP